MDAVGTTPHAIEFMEQLDAYMRWYRDERVTISPGGLSTIRYRQAKGFARDIVRGGIEPTMMSQTDTRKERVPN